MRRALDSVSAVGTMSKTAAKNGPELKTFAYYPRSCFWCAPYTLYQSRRPLGSYRCSTFISQVKPWYWKPDQISWRCVFLRDWNPDPFVWQSCYNKAVGVRIEPFLRFGIPIGLLLYFLLEKTCEIFTVHGNRTREPPWYKPPLNRQPLHDKEAEIVHI